MDFMFLGPKEVAGQTLACMVVREAETRMTMAAAVPYKTTGTYISELIVAFLHETGCLHGDIIVHRAVRSGACGHEHHRGSGKDLSPERWREIRCRKQSRWLESVERCGGGSHSVCTGPGTSVEIGFGKTLGHSDPGSALGDSLGGRVGGVPLEPVRSGPRREDRVRKLERQEGENAWDCVWWGSPLEDEAGERSSGQVGLIVE